MDTFLRYTDDIRQQYERARLGIYADFLNNPSAGKLLNLCLLKFDNTLTQSDRQIFAIFFQVPAENLSRKHIERYDLSRFRTIEYFLKGRNKTTSPQNLNLIAVLLDFEPRPYAKYIQSADNRTLTDNEDKEDQPKNEDPLPPPVDPSSGNSGKDSFVRRSALVGALALIVLTFTIGMGYSLLSSSPTCMTWQNDRYIPVECKADSITNGRDIEPFDKKKAALRMISVDSNTICFKDEKPQLWYIQRAGGPYFFNQPGEDPLTGKKLRPISRKICEKHILKIQF
jgi:hypothetical protein